ncbi:MAG: transcription antitermination factor NusB [Nitriliruptoraceae bacterium]
MVDADDPSSPRRTDTTNPHQARAHALRLLYQADLRGLDPQVVLASALAEPAARRVLDGDNDETIDVDIDGFTQTLVAGVADTLTAIDEQIAAHAHGWQIRRMPVVDRTILRLATYELLHESTPSAVVIDEAVEFAKSWSTDDSSRYVNGVLEAIRRALTAPV